jgi:hypothetical protein
VVVIIYYYFLSGNPIMAKFIINNIVKHLVKLDGRWAEIEGRFLLREQCFDEIIWLWGGLVIFL